MNLIMIGSNASEATYWIHKVALIIIKCLGCRMLGMNTELNSNCEWILRCDLLWIKYDEIGFVCTIILPSCLCLGSKLKFQNLKSTRCIEWSLNMNIFCLKAPRKIRVISFSTTQCEIRCPVYIYITIHFQFLAVNLTIFLLVCTTPSNIINTNIKSTGNWKCGREGIRH